MHQRKTYVMEGKDTMWDGGYWCPRRPQARSVDVGFSAQDVRSALSLPPPPPPTCAAAGTGACLEFDGVDDDCCAPCGFGGCAAGYTYAGQVIFDNRTLSSTYPDFGPFCNAIFCGNTCCVPSDEWDGARAAAGD